MAQFEDLEVWRQIPPEEKLEMMARAHAKGLTTSLGVILLGSTCAIAFQEVSLMWGTILVSPIIFQMSASKAWRGLKPVKILRYLAARSAARRYAYTAQSSDLTMDLIFQGAIEEVIDESNAEEVLEAAARNVKATEAWITLFKDTVVVMSEKTGGAKSELVAPIDHKLLVDSNSLDGQDYSTSKEVYLTTVIPGLDTLAEEDTRTRYKLTSASPGALVVFEKKLLELKKKRELEAIKMAKMATADGAVEVAEESGGGDDFDNFTTMMTG
jgi:6-pyruvoyl-tetrahydropterin synthase